jgi:hypothetical protein
MPQYSIWTTKPHTGDRADCVASYANRGHAIAKIKGLRRASWAAGSEMQYALQVDRGPAPRRRARP